jgi:ribosome-binding protein aMBF1 (putative translation factor)
MTYCKYCGQALQAENTLTMAGVEINICLWCAVMKNDIVEQYWGLSWEKLEDLRLLREKLGL